MTKITDGEWLLSVLPSATASSDGRRLELHKRVVHLATLREDALSKLQQLDAVKVSLTEKKVIQQSRLVAALDARLAAAHATVDPHRAAVHHHIKALEDAAAYYSNVLQDVAAYPDAADWANATEQYLHLQQQQLQSLQQLVPSQLLDTLGASLQPCSASHVEVVEKLRTDNDQLVMQLQEARNSSQQASQQVNTERAARLLAEQQKQSMHEELLSLRRVAENVARHLQLSQQQYLSDPKHKQQQLCSTAPATLGTQPDESSGNAAEQFLAECRQLRQQLQQLSAPTATVDTATTAAASTTEASMVSCQPAAQHEQSVAASWPIAEQMGLQPFDAAAVLAGDPLQELRQSLMGGDKGDVAQARLQGKCGEVAGLRCSSDTRESRLRQAYQQMLTQVQARYQQEIRQLEAQHQQALQSQAKSHTEALSQLTQQHQDVCSRLATAAGDAADMQQQADLLQRENQQLKKQVQQLQSKVADARSSSLALAQVQYEQQLMALKKEHEQLVQQAKLEIDELKQQVKQQAAALPTAASITAIVQEAATSQVRQQEAAYQSALQQREQQHISLLQELEQLRQLNAEPSVDSVQGTVPQQQQQPQSNHLATSPTGSQVMQADRGSSDQDYTLKAWQDFAEGAQQASESMKVSSTEAKQQEGPSPMSSLISAVLGTRPKAKELQAAHAKRVHRQQVPAPAAQQQSEVQSTARLLHAMDYQGQLAELDQVLGLGFKSPEVATCLPALVHKQSRSCPELVHSKSSSVDALAAQTSERVSVAAEIKRQQSGLWPTQPAQHSRSRSTSPALRRQQQWAIGDSSKQHNSNSSLCLRCGSNDALSPGRCCFHPGLVPAPGPLMYSPEWHACRAACTTDMPGCYCRREHYYLPQFSAAAGRNSSTAGTGLVRHKQATNSGAVSAGSTPAAVNAVNGCRPKQSLTPSPGVIQRRCSPGVQGWKGTTGGSQSEHQGDLMPRRTIPVPVASRRS